MPFWKYIAFKETADSAGEITYPPLDPSHPPSPLSAPISGRALRISVQTTAGCSNRSHNTVIEIKKVLEANEPPHEITIGPFEFDDCGDEPTQVAIDYHVESGREYWLSAKVRGFAPGELVEGNLGVYYSLGFARAPGPLSGYEQQIPAENAAREYLKNNFSGTYWNRDDWDNKKYCGYVLGSQNDDLWKREWVDVDPDLDSISIWIDWGIGNGYGTISIGFTGHVHYIQWSCGIRDYDHEISPRGHANFRIDVDVSNRTAEVHLSAEVQIDDVAGIPDWASSAVGELIEKQLRNKFDQIRPDLERELQDNLNKGYGSTTPAAFRVNTLYSVFGLQRMIQEPQLYAMMLDDLPQNALARMVHFNDELNQGYIARKLNEQNFPFHVDRIDTDPTNPDRNIYFENLDIVLTPSVSVGSVRILTAPAIMIILDDALCSFTIEGQTNLFASKQISISGAMTLAFEHTYEYPEITFKGLTITSLLVKQAPPFSEFVRSRLNALLPDKMKDNHDLLGAVADALNNAIETAIGGSRATHTLLTHKEFATQLKLFATHSGRRVSGCGCK